MSICNRINEVHKEPCKDGLSSLMPKYSVLWNGAPEKDLMNISSNLRVLVQTESQRVDNCPGTNRHNPTYTYTKEVGA